MISKSPQSSVVHMTELVLPSHTNALDSVFGGVIMSWIDIAAAIAAQRHSQNSVVTASIDALHFLAPVYVGWVVNLKALVTFVSTTSMEIRVDVKAEDPTTGTMFPTAQAYLTFVSIDKDGKPIPVPKLNLETDQEVQRFKEGELRRAERLKLAKKLKALNL